MIRKILMAIPLALLAVAAIVPETSAQSVLKVSRGLKSNNINVFINRAIVLESSVRFLEVSVASPEIADVSPLSDRSLYIFGRRRGVTTLTLLGEGGRLITNVTIRVEADHSELKKRLREILPNEKIEVRTANGGIILSGVVSGKLKIDKAMVLARAYAGDAVANMMTVGGTQQVMLKVKIAEISRSAGKDLGISFGVTGGTGDFSTTGVTGQNVRPRIENGLITGLERTFLDAGTFSGTLGAALTIFDSFIMSIQIDALEQKGFARTLAEPNLVALSGSNASFLAGGEAPIPVVGAQGAITVSFKPVGVGLSFRPKVLDNDVINLAIEAEVSAVDPTLSNTVGVEVFGFSTRRAETTIELRDGQAFAIAGLLQERYTDTIDQVPWLGDLPVLGTLFRSTDFQRGETELVIIVSAHLVVPVDDESDLTLPNDRIAIPNEVDLFLLGKTHEGSSPYPVGQSGMSFDGDYGYVVE